MTDLPAILGGLPVFPEGPPVWPGPDPAVREALLECWADGSWGAYDGGLVARLESTLASWVNRRHALAVASGTLALELALKAVGVAKGDAIVLCDYDYPGNFLTVHALGAVPVLVDVDAASGQMSPESLERTLAAADLTRIAAVILSPMHGSLPRYGRIQALCKTYGTALIEDACQVPGARFGDAKVGSFGSISLWSFGGSKLLSAGRGGIAFCDDAVLFQRMKMSNTRGSQVAALSELQAAAVLAQWPQFEKRQEQRAAGAEALRSLVQGMAGIRLPARNHPPKDQAYYKWDFFWNESEGGLTREQLVGALKAEGIGAEVGFRSLHAGRSRSRYRAHDELIHSKEQSPQRIVLHHPVLLQQDGPQKVAAALHRMAAHARRIAELT